MAIKAIINIILIFSKIETDIKYKEFVSKIVFLTLIIDMKITQTTSSLMKHLF